MEITIDTVMALNTCPGYPREKVEALVQRLSTETPFTVLSSIPAEDAFWLISKILPKPERGQWAKDCAQRAKEYAEGATRAAAAARWAAARWAAAAADAADAADAAMAAYWVAHYAARAAQYADRAAYYAGGKAAQKAEQHLAILHGLQLLEGAK